MERFDAGQALSGRVAFLPSAYNPPTLGHLRLLHEALALDGVDSVAAMLTTRNVDKAISGAALADRIGMLLALHESHPDFAVTAANAARILEQADALSREMSGAGVDVVVGFDTLIRLFEPRYYRDVERELAGFFANHRVIAANRGDETLEGVERWVRENAGDFQDRILVREIDAAAALVSSTKAREAATERPERMPVPPRVRQYIEARGLYRDLT